MWLLFLEAFGAMMALVLIIWWTMFAGRKDGELHDATPSDDESSKK